jgi:hypothetical protein
VFDDFIVVVLSVLHHYLLSQWQGYDTIEAKNPDVMAGICHV